MNKFAIVGLVSVAAGVSLFAVGTTTAFAYQGNSTAVGPYHTEEREASMETIMANKDYSAWVKLMTEDGRNPGILRKIDSQEDFNKFVEVYNLEHAGKDASALKQELGLGIRQGTGTGAGTGNGMNRNGTCINQ